MKKLWRDPEINELPIAKTATWDEEWDNGCGGDEIYESGETGYSYEGSNPFDWIFDLFGSGGGRRGGRRGGH